MRFPRLRVRTLLMTVAVVAVLLAGGFEYARLNKLSKRYASMALAFSGNVQRRLAFLAAIKAKRKTLWDLPNANAAEIEMLGVLIEENRANIAANANLVLIYEHAASHPWESPPLSVEAVGDAPEKSPVVKRFPANPNPPPLPPKPD